MKIVFVGDNLSIHQKPLSDKLFALLGENYLFVATKPMTQERINMGWTDFTKESPYAMYVTPENQKSIEEKIEEADAVIIGAAKTRWVKNRLQNNKLVFRYQERPFKRTTCLDWLRPKSILGIFRSSIIWQRKNYHLLAASAYAYYDFSKFFCFKNKAWKFGYFINPIQEEFFERKNEVIQISWIGRMIQSKHCEMVLNAAYFLKEQGIHARFNIIGQGKMENEMIALSQSLGVEDSISFCKSKSNQEIRDFLAHSDIHLITSDSNEGWGVVTNESMSAGCCVISSKQTGAAPFLIQHMENGLLFDVKKQDEMNSLLKTAVLNKDLRISLGKKAVETMNDVWSPGNAAEQLIQLVVQLNQGRNLPKDFANKQGPCSPAKLIK